MWEILHAIEYGPSAPLSPVGDPPSYLRHELKTGTMWVAETGGAPSAADAAASLDAIVRWSRRFGHVVHVGIPGPHPSLPALIRAGFRIKFVETYCCSSPTDLFDPRTYIPSKTMEGTALL